MSTINGFMPTTLLALTSVSLLNSLISFILAFFNYGLLAVWLSAASALVTLLYHMSALLLSYRRWYRRKGMEIVEGMRGRMGGNSFNNNYPTTPPIRHYSFATLVWSYVLLAMWLVIFGLVLQVTIGGMMGLDATQTNTSWNFGVQIGESVLAGFEFLLMVAIVVHSTIGNKRETYEDMVLAEQKKRYEAQSPVEEKPVRPRSSFISVSDNPKFIAALPPARLKGSYDPSAV